MFFRFTRGGELNIELKNTELGLVFHENI